MLDPKIIRDEPDRIKQMLKDRAVKFDFEKMLELNKIRKEMMMEVIVVMLPECVVEIQIQLQNQKYHVQLHLF